MRFEVEIWGMEAKVSGMKIGRVPNPKARIRISRVPQTTWDPPCGPALISLSLSKRKKNHSPQSAAGGAHKIRVS